MLECLRLNPNDDVKKKLESFFLEKKSKEMVIIGALGSIINVELTNAKEKVLPPTVQKTYISGPFEVTSFFGEIILDEEEKPKIHIHTAGSLKDSNVHGGGLSKAEVFRGLQVFIYIRQ